MFIIPPLTCFHWSNAVDANLESIQHTKTKEDIVVALQGGRTRVSRKTKCNIFHSERAPKKEERSRKGQTEPFHGKH